MSQEDPTKNYLERTEQLAKERASTKDEREEIWRELNTRFEGAQWGEAGVMEFELPINEGNDILKITVEYDSVLDEKFANYSGQFSSPDDWEDRPDYENFRRVLNITLQNSDHAFNIKEMVGDQWSVFCNIADFEKLRTQHNAFSAFTSPIRKYIMMFKDLLSPGGMSTLFHELKHVELIDAGTSAEKRLHSRGEMTEAQKTEMVAEERKCDAFSLKMLRQFFGDAVPLQKIKKQMYDSQNAYHRKPIK